MVPRQKTPGNTVIIFDSNRIMVDPRSTLSSKIKLTFVYSGLYKSTLITQNITRVRRQMEDIVVTHNHSLTTDHVIPPYTNYAFAAVYVTCMVVGLPGNIISLQYFVTCARQTTTVGNKTFFNNLLKAYDEIFFIGV